MDDAPQPLLYCTLHARLHPCAPVAEPATMHRSLRVALIIGAFAAPLVFAQHPSEWESDELVGIGDDDGSTGGVSPPLRECRVTGS